MLPQLVNLRYEPGSKGTELEQLVAAIQEETARKTQRTHTQRKKISSCLHSRFAHWLAGGAAAKLCHDVRGPNMVNANEATITTARCGL